MQKHLSNDFKCCVFFVFRFDVRTKKDWDLVRA